MEFCWIGKMEEEKELGFCLINHPNGMNKYKLLY